ncbi:MAG: signal transduction histidine kinase, partial [Phenylobacterium sp.]
HEINNPTNFVHVSTQNLEIDLSRFQQFLFGLVGDDADEAILDSFKERFEPLYTHLETIKKGTERIKIIVKDLRAFTQLDSAEQKTVKITDLLQSMVNLVQTRYQKVAEFSIQFDATPELYCYPAQLNQVFMNLIVNACDAIECRLAGLQGVRASKVKGRVVIGCQTLVHGGHSGHSGQSVIEVFVSDNGCGMTDDVKNHLFEPFFTTKEVGKGTGLGLSIAFGIVQKHGGELLVESELGVGSVLRVRL